jgi:2-hydroxychromene-2-carboxylate isomerase
MRRFVAAEGAERVRLSHALFAAYWVSGEDVTRPAVLSAAAGRAGLDGAWVDRALADPEVKLALRAGTDDALARGVFGAPSFWVEPQGVLFWGQDRLAFVEKALGGWVPRAG